MLLSSIVHGELRVKYGVAVWNYLEPDVRLCDLVKEMSSFGFDAVSFLPDQILELDDGATRELLAVVRGEELLVTLHGKCGVSREDIDLLIGRFEENLYAMTFDPAVSDSASGLDVPRMAQTLSRVDARSAGSSLKFAIEDFPLTGAILDENRRHLEPLLGSRRLGTLLDVGHCNLRRTQEDEFAGLSVAEYFSQAPLPIIEIHVHDNAGDRDSHAPIGFGNIDFPEVAAALKAIRFNGISTIEIAPAFHGSAPEESKPHLRRTLDEWRRLFGQ